MSESVSVHLGQLSPDTLYAFLRTADLFEFLQFGPSRPTDELVIGAKNTLSFRHALIQKAIYDHLLENVKEEVHSHIASYFLESYEEMFGDMEITDFEMDVEETVSVDHGKESGSALPGYAKVVEHLNFVAYHLEKAIPSSAIGNELNWKRRNHYNEMDNLKMEVYLRLLGLHHRVKAKVEGLHVYAKLEGLECWQSLKLQVRGASIADEATVNEVKEYVQVKLKSLLGDEDLVGVVTEVDRWISHLRDL
jgi:hypothetical protein